MDDDFTGKLAMLKHLGPYRLERLLGRGGMGCVYAGVHEETGQRAAIKSLSLSLADEPNFRSRFLVEVETLKQLRHPNIVQILGDGEQDGQLFYVMELVEGQNLQELLQSGHQFSWREVTHIAIDICAALKHAHDCGVIHRDIKPANLLRTADGGVKLTDFGIAKLFGATHRTAAGSVVGTADYMAPEQADGRQVTNRTDLYSLGAVMFTLLARRTPFQGGSLAQVVHRLKYEEAPSVRRFAPQVPEALDQIIGELMRKDPQQRAATALVLANRLRAMEHVLAALEDVAAVPGDASTHVAAPDTDGDSATAVVKINLNPVTKVGPTRVDRDGNAAEDKFAWNEATVDTPPPPPASRAPVTGQSPASPTLHELAPAANRFTTIDEDRRDRLKRRDATGDDTGSAWSSVAWIIALLLVLGGLCVWGLWPPSADSLYQRIQAAVRRQDTAAAWNDIDRFLKRFPQDPRFQEIDGLRQDVECDWLESRLRLRKRKTDGQGLQPYEQQWLAAYHLRAKDPQAALASWESLIQQYGQEPNPSQSLKIVLDAARHQLTRRTPSERTP